MSLKETAFLKFSNESTVQVNIVVHALCREEERNLAGFAQLRFTNINSSLLQQQKNAPPG